MSEVERLIRYCKVDTQSDPDNENVTPSSEKQFNLAKMLKQELEELGLEDVTLDVNVVLNQEQLKEIAETKLPDLNAYNLEEAIKIVSGTAKNMGIEITE